MSAAVLLSGVTKSYGRLRAVDGIDLAIPRGTIYGLLGPNGAGKTTTIRMVIGLLLPDSGTISVLGLPPGEEANRSVGYIPEERGLYRKMRVLEQLVFFARARGVPAQEAGRRAAAELERFGLRAFGSRRLEELSKGMQQKVQFIAAILHEPELLVLDEPFSGLDPMNARLMKDQILHHREAGRTVIFSTHVMEQAEKLCDAIALIDRSRVVLEGPISGVKDRFRRNCVQLVADGNPERLRSLPDVEAVRPHGAGFEVDLAGSASADVFLRGAMERMTVREYCRKEPTLEEIFLEVVGRPGAEGAA